MVVKTGMKISMPSVLESAFKTTILCKLPTVSGKMNIKAICFAIDLKMVCLLTPNLRKMIYLS